MAIRRRGGANWPSPSGGEVGAHAPKLLLEYASTSAPLGDLACRLAGSTDPFDQTTLDALYLSNKDYVDQVKQDAKRLRKEKFLTKEGEKEIVERAKASGIPD